VQQFGDLLHRFALIKPEYGLGTATLRSKGKPGRTLTNGSKTINWVAANGLTLKGFVVRATVDVHTPKANVQYTTLDRKPLRPVRNRHQTNTILNTSHEPKSTTVLELKCRSYEMFTIIQEFTEKYRGFRGSLFSIHPLSGCERLRATASKWGFFIR